MTQRIKCKFVERNIAVLNARLKRPMNTWYEGKFSIGNFHLYAANGYYSLHVIMNEAGAVHNMYTGTLREIDIYVRGMLDGSYLARHEVA